MHAVSCMRGEDVDLATIIGLLGALFIIMAAIFLGGDPVMFLDAPSFLIVIGGTVFVVMSKFGMNQFAGALSGGGQGLLFRPEESGELIARIVELANLARRGGLLALEEQPVSNRFLADGLRLLIDGHDAEHVQAALSKDRRQAMERHEWGQRIFLAMADVGPAMGMIPKSIGPAMAVALLTTLYGSLLANVVCLPIADKLKLRGAEEATQHALVVDGLLAMQAGQNPRVIQGLLERYLPAGQRPAPA